MFSIHRLGTKKSFIPLVLFIACSSITPHKAIAKMKLPKQYCSISINSTPLSTDQVSLNFSLQNPYDRNMRLLIWYTPFEGFFSDLFMIKNRNTGEQLNYQGPMVKRLQPQLEDYLSISANEISSITLNLSLAYAFTQGNYQLHLKKNIFHFEDDNLTPFPLFCETTLIEFSIE